MEKTVYLGGAQLNIRAALSDTPVEIDPIFFTPVLPVTAVHDVTIRSCESLPLPERYAFTHDKIAVWFEDGAEHRAYRTRFSDEPVAMSLRRGASVEVLVRRSHLAALHLPFVPWYYLHLESLLLENGAFLLHAASILHREKAILFTAPSGTGKTTQTELWHRYIPGTEDLNGDLTLLQKTAAGWYACGFPIAGSSGRCYQKAAPLRAVAVVRRAPEDSITDLSAAQKLALLYGECKNAPFTGAAVEGSLDLLTALATADGVDILQLNCTMKQTAAELLHRRLYGVKHGTV